MSDRDFELNGIKFKLRKLNVFDQFHLARKIGPVIGEVVPIAQNIKSDSKASQEEMLEQNAKFITPIFNWISSLSDADAQKVLCTLLSAVEMQQVSGNWAKVATDSVILFQDLELPFLIQLAARAFMYNLAGFFQGSPRK